MNNRDSVSLSLAILSVAALVSGSTATTMVYASHHSTSSNTGSPSSTPSTSGSSSTPSTSGSSSTPSTSGSSSTPSTSGSSSTPSTSGSSSSGALVVQDRRHQVATAAVAVVEVLHIVIGQATRPVPVSVPKLVRTPLGLVVLLVTARLFVVHITLRQDHPPLLPSQALPLKKGILQQAQSGIRPHRPTRQMLHIAINQPIHLAIA